MLSLFGGQTRQTLMRKTPWLVRLREADGPMVRSTLGWRKLYMTSNSAINSCRMAGVSAVVPCL